MVVQTAITVFNRRLDADRREAYFPTCIKGASYFAVCGSEHSADGVHSEKPVHKLRVPVGAEAQNGRSYVSEKAYQAMAEEDAAGCWTLQRGDILLAKETCLLEPLDEAALRRLAASLAADIITIKEYADNTIRGTAAVRHWRIGGE